MNPFANIAGWVRSHQKETMLGAGGVVAALALAKRNSSKGGGTIAQGAPYDSVATDVTSTIEPQISSLAGELYRQGQLLDRLGTQVTTSVQPTPPQAAVVIRQMRNRTISLPSTKAVPKPKAVPVGNKTVGKTGTRGAQGGGVWLH